MKYTQYSDNKKGSSAFYIIIAVCLVIIGVAAWVAFTDSDKKPDTATPSQNKTESKINEYNSSNDSYISSVPQTPQSDGSNPVDQDVKGEKYTSSKVTTKKPKSYTMPVNGDILKDFSLKTLQFSATYNDMRIHAAVDIACTEGTFVTSVTDGKIQSIEQTADYGKCVTIDHGDGLVIKYCGLKNIVVEKDTPIKMGDRIGAVTTIPCECSDQSHIHIEVYENGKAVSLLKFFE